jgi:hypothetical protein
MVRHARVKRGQAAHAAAVNEAGFDEGQVLQSSDELAGGKLQPLLAQLAFEQAVSQQGDHME